MKALKRFVAILFVLVLCSVSVWAFPGHDIFSRLSSPEEVSSEVSLEVSPVSEAKETAALKKVHKDLKEISNPVSTLLTDFDFDGKISKEEKAELKAKLNQAVEDVDQMIVERNKIRKFINAGAVMSFKDKKPVIGVTAGAGLKFRNGMTAELGIDYDIYNFGTKTTTFKDETGIDALTGRLSVGYMW